MTSTKTNGACMDFPELSRLNYFFGQMLGVDDFRTEQNYFREKLKLHNRCLHGYGVVCGLQVEPVPIPKECGAKEQAEEKALWEELQRLIAEKAAHAAAPPAPATPAPATPAPAQGAAQAPAQAAGPEPPPQPDLDAQIESLRRQLGDFYRTHCKEEPRTRVRINCGLALDCCGNELILREALDLDLAEWMSAADYQRVKQGAHEVYISICYCERSLDPVRPVMPGSCGATPDCTFGKTQQGVRFLITVDPPAADTRCETCCEPCSNGCLLLSRIDCFFPGHELHPDHIHNGVRRPLCVYQPTTITGVSWKFNHHYTPHEARRLMGTHDRGQHHGRGLEIRFSRPVLASTIHRGVFDTWVIEGGRGRSGNIYNKSGELIDKPEEGLVDRIFYRDTTDETLEPGDRVLVILRTDFILDQCCRPVDGENTGGRVPILREYAEEFGLHENHHHEAHFKECCVPPKGYGPWTSGNGSPGATFESWFFIREGEWDSKR